MTKKLALISTICLLLLATSAFGTTLFTTTTPPVVMSWAITYGSASADEIFAIQQSADGGYAAAGHTSSFGAGGDDIWLLKLDSAGTVLWQKAYGGRGPDIAYDVQQTYDGGYIVAGETSSFGAGGTDAWVLKLDSGGNVLWQKAYGGSGSDIAYTVEQTYDGGYIVAGETSSFGSGGNDAWVFKLDAFGTVVWQRTYGGSLDDYANSVQQTSDGGFIVGGFTESFGDADGDAWAMKLDVNGNISGCAAGFMQVSSATITNTTATVTSTSVAAAGVPTYSANDTSTSSTVTPTAVAETGRSISGSTVNLPALSGGKYWNPAAYNGTNKVLSLGIDTTGPTISATSPSSGAVNVFISSPITVNFSEDLAANTIIDPANTFTVKDSGNNPVAGIVTYNSGTKTATFTPSSNLAYGMAYTATITTGAKDLAGNPMAAPDYTWSFTTQCAPLSGLVSQWSAENTANDSLGVNNGALVGGATFVPGKIGQSFSFNSASSSGVSVPSSSSLNTSNAITMAAWVKPISMPNAYPSIIRRQLDSGGNQYIIAVTDTGQAHCNISDFANPTGGTIPLNQWSYVVCTYDRLNARLYINGVEVASQPATQQITSSSQNLGIGKQYGANDRNFDGLIDEVAIYNRALTQTEIQAIYNTQYTGSCTDTTAPSVVSTLPADKATGIAVNSAVSATFSEFIDLATITEVTFTLRSAGGSVTGVVGYNAATRTATFTPSVALDHNATYTATLTTGVKDTAGNGLATAYSWRFQTETPATGIPAARADYQFQNTMASSVAGVPDLTQIETNGLNTFIDEPPGNATQKILHFNQNNGVLLNPASAAVSADTYTISMIFRFDATSGYRRILDFKNGTSDTGLYNLNGYLNFYNIATGPSVVIQPGTYLQIVLRRDLHGVIDGYVNGVKQFMFADTSQYGVISAANVVRFFVDDIVAPNETSAGTVSRIRLYDTALTDAEILALNNDSSYSCTPAPSGIVSWWPGNGNANDVIGGNNGTLMNGATFAAGKVGQSFSVNGTNQFILNSSPRNMDLTSNFTLMGWINPKSAQLGGIIDRGVETSQGWSVWFNPNQSLLYSQNYNRGTIEELSTSAGSVPLNAWTNFAVVYTNLQATIYINGVVAGSHVFNSNPVVNGSDWVEIGVNRPGGDEYFNGLFDELAVYNRALTQTEIEALYNSGSSGSCSDISAPSVIASNPTGGSVPLNSAITATFSDFMDESRINNSTFTVNGLTATSVSYNHATKTASFIYSGSLSSNTSYTGTIKSGATGVKDLAGNPLASDYTWNFTTLTCPEISLTPTLSDGATGIAYNRTIIASGGIPTYTYKVSLGVLPDGVMLNSSTGALTGSPTTSGTFNFTVTATDANICKGSQGYTLTITQTTSFSAVNEFSIANGNPNGVWSYGWMPTNFSQFNQYVNQAISNGNPIWGGWNSDFTPAIWKNLGSPAYGVPTGWLSLHPGPGTEPSVMRWTAPSAGYIHVTGQFLAGDSGTMQVAVRLNGQPWWYAVNQGAFDLSTTVSAGSTVDFTVYGGYWYGNTPVEATITYTALLTEYAVDANTIALYHFNTATAGLTPDSVGRHDGSLKGNAQITEAGRFGAGLLLDGSGSYVRTGNVHQNPLRDYSKGSVEAWVKISAASSYMVILGSGTEYGSSWDNGWFLGRHPGFTGNNLGFMIWSGGWWRVADSGLTPESLTGGWHHVAGTWGPKGIEIWVDGVLKSANTSWTSPPDDPFYSTALVGTDSWRWDTNGIIDEVRISDIQRDFSLQPVVTDCTYTLTPSSQSVPAAGGNFSIGVTANSPGCSWTATTTDSWITGVIGGTTGNGAVTYNISANNGPQRSGSIKIGGETFTVTQLSGCTFTTAPLSPNPADFAAIGGTGTFSVTASNNLCNWTALSGDITWLTTIGSGTGTTTGSFTVLANTGAPRAATISVGGSFFTVNQGTGCAYTLMPSSQIVPAAGGSFSIEVTATSPSCVWKAETTNSWINIVSGNATGNGTVNYNISGNNGPEITGTIKIGGQAFTVKQLSGCTFSIAPLSPSPADFAATGGTGTFNISASNELCGWTAVSGDNTWLTATGSGIGSKTGFYTVQANTGRPRLSTINVGGSSFTVNQGTGCAYTLTPSSQSVPAAGGSFSIGVTATSPGCSWTATTTDSWITGVTGGATGNGTITYNVSSNNGPQRTGTINVSGQIFTVTQLSGCTFSIAPLSPNPADFAATGGTGTFSVSASNELCDWTALSGDNTWITATGSGTGSTTGSYTILANTGGPRSASVNIGGSSFTVNQGTGCAYTLTPSSQIVPAAAGSFSLAVVATATDCVWTATTTDSWITGVTGGATGDGIVTYNVAENTGLERAGAINIGGQAFSVTQVSVPTVMLTSASGPGGTISPSGVLTAMIGTSQIFYITPNPGYVLTDVIVDGRSMGPVYALTLINLAGNHTISVSFGAK